MWSIADYPTVMTCHFKASEKLIFPDRHSILSLWQRKKLVITVRRRWWPPCRGKWLLTTEYFGWEEFYFVLFWLKSKIDDLIWVTDLVIIRIWRRLLSFCCRWIQIQCLCLPIWITPNYTCFLYKAYLFTKCFICSSCLLLFNCL